MNSPCPPFKSAYKSLFCDRVYKFTFSLVLLSCSSFLIATADMREINTLNTMIEITYLGTIFLQNKTTQTHNVSCASYNDKYWIKNGINNQFIYHQKISTVLYVECQHIHQQQTPWCKCNTFYAQDKSESEYYTNTILNTTQGLYSSWFKPCDRGSWDYTHGEKCL